MTKKHFWSPVQFVRQKLETLRTWSIIIQIEKKTPQNRKSWRTWSIGQGPKLQKIHFLNQKTGLGGSRNFLTFHLPFEVMVTSLTSHSKGSLHIQRVGELLYIEIRFLNFFFAYHPRVEGDIFGSEKFWIFRPHIGFPSKLDFQKSSICSNKYLTEVMYLQ